MSQRDLTAELRASRVAAPAGVRNRVRAIAAADASSPRFSFTRVSWRRALVIAVPVAAALTAGILLTVPRGNRDAVPIPQPGIESGTVRGKSAPAGIPGTPDASTGAGSAAAGAATIAPQTSATRIQRYGASLALRLATADAVSDGVKQALRVTGSLGGYPTSVHATSHGKTAAADLTLKIPRVRVQPAITRLSAIGAIVSEQVEVQDVQTGIDTAARTITRLQRQLRDLRAQTKTPAVAKKIAALTAQVERLQRTQAATVRATRYATISLHLSTPPTPVPAHHANGPLHGLGIAFHWIWIGAAYALALGLPLVVLAAAIWLGARAVRRRREDALLSSP